MGSQHQRQIRMEVRFLLRSIPAWVAPHPCSTPLISPAQTATSPMRSQQTPTAMPTSEAKPFQIQAPREAAVFLLLADFRRRLITMLEQASWLESTPHKQETQVSST